MPQTLIGENVKVEVKGDKLVVEIDLKATGRPSSTGKNIVIASTGGNKSIPTPDGSVTLGVFCYKAKTAAPAVSA